MKAKYTQMIEVKPAFAKHLAHARMVEYNHSAPEARAISGVAVSSILRIESSKSGSCMQLATFLKLCRYAGLYYRHYVDTDTQAIVMEAMRSNQKQTV